MQAIFPFGLKILFDGYLIERWFSTQYLLIIRHFLFDGYLMESPLGFKILCDGYVTKSPFQKLKSLIINIFLCDRHVTESQKILFDGYLTGNTFLPQKRS